MNVPPPAEQKPAIQGTPTQISSGFGVALGALAILPFLFLIIFHLGAGYLSYQKYGNIGWAVLDFLFAYFYYPYYAFFLANAPAEPAPVAAPTMLGGFMKLFGGKRRR